MRRQMTVVYGLCAWMENPTTRRLSIIRDLSICDGITGWGVHGVGINCTDPIIPKQFSRIGRATSKWSNLVVFRYWKERLRRTYHQIIFASCLGTLI